MIHQKALNAYSEGSARAWGAYAWEEGDFVLHLAGCPLVEGECRERLLEASTRAEEANKRNT